MKEDKTLIKLSKLKPGEAYHVNIYEYGSSGAVCYYCDGLYLLFEIPIHGGEKVYRGTYFKHQLEDLFDEILSWN